LSIKEKSAIVVYSSIAWWTAIVFARQIVLKRFFVAFDKVNIQINSLFKESFTLQKIASIL